MTLPKSFRSSALVLCSVMAFAPGLANAEKRTPAPIEYAGQGSVPQPNANAIRDPWRGPVTKTRPGVLPQQRQKVQFSYPGSVTPSVEPMQQMASVEPRPSAATPPSPKSLWPEDYQAPALAQPTPSTANQTLLLGSGATPAPTKQVTMQPVAAGVLTDQHGLASWYGEEFDGLPTANGEVFDMDAMTAAHKTLPLPSLVQVTNEANGKEIVVRVNDRGPFVDDRIIDLSHRAATALDIIDVGAAPVTVRYLGPAPALPGGETTLVQNEVTQPVQQASLDPVPEPEPSRTNLYGDMLLGGYEPSLGIPDPGKSTATPAQLASVATKAPVPSSVPSTPRIVSANLPAIEARPQAIPASSPPPRRVSTGFTPTIFVQVGAFADISNAQGMNAQVGGRYPVDVEPVRVHGADYFRVLVGPFPSRQAAESAKFELKARGVSDGFIVVR